MQIDDVRTILHPTLFGSDPQFGAPEIWSNCLIAVFCIEILFTHRIAAHLKHIGTSGQKKELLRLLAAACCQDNS